MNISEKTSDYIRKATIFLAVLILHVVGFDFILHYKFTYKIYRFKDKAVAAFIISKEKIVAPRMDNMSAGRPGGETLSAKPTAGGSPSGSGRAGPERPPTSPPEMPGPQTGRPQGPGGPAQGTLEVRGELKESRILSSEFRLTIPPKSDLVLSKAKGNLEDSYLPRDKYRARTDIDFSPYLFPAGPASSAAGGGSGSGRAGRTGAKAYIGGGTAPANIRRVDLSSWANAVLIRIQKNWSIAAAGDFAWKGEVGITVMIGKNGNLTLIEVIASSKVDALDRAALRALELSAPFPSLPADFPDSSLEVYLIFQYGG